MPEVLKGVQIGQRLVPSFLVPRSGLKSMCNSCVSVHRSARKVPVFGAEICTSKSSLSY